MQALIDLGWLKFQEDKPNIEVNPLFRHGNAPINAIGLNGHKLVKNVSEIQSSWRFIFEALLIAGLLEGEYNLSKACEFHSSAKHFVESCNKFRTFLQNLIDKNFVQVCREGKEEEVFAQTGEKYVMLPSKPLIVHFARSTLAPTSQKRKSVVILSHSPFPYKSKKTVPWKYGIHVLGEGQQTKNQSTDVEPIVENILGIRGMTRSGRIFTPPILRKGVVGNEGIATGEIKELLKEKDVQTQEWPKIEEKQEISNAEACEFLKFIQQSEYKVVEQLKCMPARISLLQLLMHSISHRKMLMKILNKAHVEQNISLDKFEAIVGNITANNCNIPKEYY